MFRLVDAHTVCYCQENDLTSLLRNHWPENPPAHPKAKIPHIYNGVGGGIIYTTKPCRQTFCLSVTGKKHSHIKTYTAIASFENDEESMAVQCWLKMLPSLLLTERNTTPQWLSCQDYEYLELAHSTESLYSYSNVSFSHQMSLDNQKQFIHPGTRQRGTVLGLNWQRSKASFTTTIRKKKRIS